MRKFGPLVALFFALSCGRNAPPPAEPAEPMLSEEDFWRDIGSWPAPGFAAAQADAWQFQTLHTAGQVYGQTGVLVENQFPGRTQVFYFVRGTWDLWRAVGYAPGPWNRAPVDTSFRSGPTGAGIFWNGLPQFAYFHATRGIRLFSGLPEDVSTARVRGPFVDVAAGDALLVVYTGIRIVNRLQKWAGIYLSQQIGGNWTETTLYEEPYRSGFRFLSADADAGILHVAFVGQDQGLYYLQWDGQNAQLEAILPGDPRTRNVAQTALVLDGMGGVHIFYTKRHPQGGLYHAWKTTTWQVEALSPGLALMSPNAAVWMNGTFSLAAYGIPSRDLVLVEGPPWQFTPLDTAGDTGLFTSLFADAQGCLHVAYLQRAGWDLRYAFRCPPLPPAIASLDASDTTINEAGWVALSLEVVEFNGDPWTVQWTQVAPASPQGVFSDAAAAQTSWHAPLVDTTTAFQLRATVCDDGNLCSSADLLITVLDLFDGPAFGPVAAPVLQCPGGAQPQWAPEEFPEIIPLLYPDPDLLASLKARYRRGSAGPGFRLSGIVPPLQQDFQGIPFTGPRPPDPHIAAGPNHLLAAVNSSFAIFLKDGTKLLQQTAASFFAPIQPPGFPFDPRVNYDPYNDRWLLLYHSVNWGGQQSAYLLAVSQTGDPTGCWYLYKLDNTLNGTTPTDTWSDYGDMGFSASELYLSANQFTFPPYQFRYTKVRVLPLADLYAGNATTYADYWNFRSTTGELAFTLRVAYPAGTPAPTEGHLVNNYWPWGQILSGWALSDSLSGHPTLRWREIPVDFYMAPPDAEQPNTTCRLDTIDNRVMNVVWRDGTLGVVYNTVFQAPSGDYSGLRIVRLESPSWARQEEYTYAAEGEYFFDGALALDAQLRLGIVFARSSPSVYPGAYYTVQYPGNPPEPAFGVLRAGNTRYRPSSSCPGRGERWGDYGGAWVDPTDDSLWIFHEYAESVTRWGTWIGQLLIP